MEIQLIRNATMRIRYGGTLLLTDPMLLPKGAIESWAGIAKNPTVDLPIPSEAVTTGIEAVLASHLHKDHFDQAAWETLPKSLPIYCQPADEDRLRQNGFETVTVIHRSVKLKGIELTRTGGQHGSGPILKTLGDVSGFVLRAQDEPTLYWAGDTVWCDEVAEVLEAEHPEIIIVHASGAKLQGSDVIVMNDEMVTTVCNEAPEAVVVAVHMEALDHATVTRAQLRQTAQRCVIPDKQLLIPEDGQTLRF